jgi:uncharacterized NAD(P)/FAD-binding protein YdhS
VPTIAIVGGGFSGTITAVHLLRASFGAGARVVVINRSGAMARGLAYGTQSDHHVLNVPAGRMSAFEDDPDSFVRFVRERGVQADGGAFVSRHLYGAYLVWLLTTAVARAAHVVFERVHDEAVRIEPAPDGTHASIITARGDRLHADRVVMAVGNYPPQPPALDDEAFVRTSRRYVADPWRPGALALVDPRMSTLLIGTGLTMVDIVLELAALGKCRGLVAVSRRGLTPLPHRTGAHAPHAAPPADLLDPPVTLRTMLRALRRAIDEASAHGVDWRDVMASIRPLTPRLWRALSIDERRRFLRHLRPFWEVHRHRMAPLLHERFTQLLETGAVSVRAARVLDLREADGVVRATLRPRGSNETLSLAVGAVVNCTGPAGDTRRLQDPLIEHLVSAGCFRPDPLGLGVDTAPSGALIGRDGRPSSTLYYVGPFARAHDWEATAVPELRQYAHRLALHLIDTFPRPMP